ncbi:hypothetical protein BPY_08970 [Bifidobacterium psychraerophilum]|jgi:RNA polymerase sigma-70 factor (ECF subfamily)
MVDVANLELEEKRRRFEALAMPAVNALYRQAMKLTNDSDDAQDLVQDTFERGFKAFDRFEPGSNFEAWMTTIQRNAFFNQYHKAKRRPQRANDSTGEYDDWDIYSASGHSSEGLKSAEQEYLEAFAPEEIMSALDTLSPERRQVFIDAAIDGKSYQQVADEQGIKIGTVMSRLNRARAQLKEQLAAYASERGYGKARDGAQSSQHRTSGRPEVSPSAKPVDAAVHNGKSTSGNAVNGADEPGTENEDTKIRGGDTSRRPVEGAARNLGAIDGRKGLA